jgi:hypothetical protein
MIVVVTGGRDYGDWQRLWAALDRVQAATPIEYFIYGDAFGADALAAQWLKSRAPESIVESCRCVAEWKRHGKGAGPKRNQAMVDLALTYSGTFYQTDDAPPLSRVLVLACPGGRGTADCVRRAKAAGLRVVTLDELNGGS